jgi:hypothetical protein
MHDRQVTAMGSSVYARSSIAQAELLRDLNLQQRKSTG